jgi:hypothetical protein
VILCHQVSLTMRNLGGTLEKNGVIMTNYVFYKAGRPMPAVAAEFFSPDHRVRPRLLGGKE